MGIAEPSTMTECVVWSYNHIICLDIRALPWLAAQSHVLAIVRCPSVCLSVCLYFRL